MSESRTVPVELLRQALEALENGKRVRAGEGGTKYQPPLEDSAIAVLRAALEQQEQEPVAWMVYTLDGKSVLVTDTPADFNKQYRVLPLYTHPPRREPEQAVPVARVLQTVGQYHTGRFVAEVETVRRLRDGESLYTNPPRCEPEPPPEPIHPDKIRAEFREMDRCCLPGEMTVEDWFTEGVRFAEKHHEIV